MATKNKIDNSIRIKKILVEIKRSKNVIAKERDKLRSAIQALDELADHCDDCIEYFEKGLDVISQTL